LAVNPLGIFSQPARQYQAAGPAEAPVGRLFQNPPGFLRAEGSIHVVRIDQPEAQVGIGQGADAKTSIAQQLAKCGLQSSRRCHGTGTSRSGPSAWSEA